MDGIGLESVEEFWFTTYCFSFFIFTGKFSLFTLLTPYSPLIWAGSAYLCIHPIVGRDGASKGGQGGRERGSEGGKEEREPSGGRKEGREGGREGVPVRPSRSKQTAQATAARRVGGWEGGRGGGREGVPASDESF